MSAAQDWDAISGADIPSGRSDDWEKIDVSAPATEQTAKAMPWHERIVQGVKDPFNAAAQLLMYSSATKAQSTLWNDVSRSLNTSIAEHEKAYQAARGKDAGIDWWRGAGNVANPINWIAPGGGASTLLARLGVNAMRGAGSAALSTPVTEGDFAAEKAKQTTIGALGGAVLTPIASGLARMVQPETQPAAKALLKEGITPTTGQILGGSAQRIEDALTSTPLLGDVIKGAQGRAIAQFNTAAYQRALDPIGEKAPAIIGREGVEKVANILGERYDKVLSQITFRPDGQFAQDLQGLKHLVASGLPEAQSKQFDNIVKTQLGKATQTGTMDGETLKGILSELRREAKGYSGDVSFDNRKLGSAIGELHSVLTNTLQRANPDKAAELKALDTGWANYARIRHAAAAQGAHDGVFTPAQLSAAVKALDKSVGHGDFAKGNALMQDLSDAGKAVLSQKIPDSGTPLRSMVALGIGGGGYLAATHPLIAAGTVAGTVAGAGAYTQTGQNLLAKILTQRPAMAPQVAEAIRRGLPLTAGPGSGVFLRDIAK